MTKLSPEELLEASPLFDADWYQTQYPDVAALKMSAVQHYLKYGWRLGRSPGAGFSARCYLEDHPDIRRAGANPLLHYLLHGEREGRRKRPVPTQAPAATMQQRATPQALMGTSTDEQERLSQQLGNTQQLLEHYFTKYQELEYRLMDGVV